MNNEGYDVIKIVVELGFIMILEEFLYWIDFEIRKKFVNMLLLLSS